MHGHRHPKATPATREHVADAESSPADSPADDRYEHLELLGRGGMGEVVRVRDRWMRRYLAMKVLLEERRASAGAREQFLHEARMTASLQHPAIVPVHDVGELSDRRPWFTMKEVRGRTVNEVIQDLHARDQPQRETPLTLRRVVEALLRACDAVAFAHSRGVVHRDLKPDNLMVGRFGEVYVMDWGLAKQLDSDEQQPSRRYEGEDPILAGVSPDARDTLFHHHDGPSESGRSELVGTLAYMSPEQAAGAPEALAPTSDVYALGAVLYEIMLGRPPFSGTAGEVWMALFDGPPPPLSSFEKSSLRPPELCAVCETAMHPDRSLRFGDARELSTALRDWLDGTRRREKALTIIAAADAAWPRIERLREEASKLRASARQRLRSVQPFDPVSVKAPAWALQDRAGTLERDAAIKEVAWQQQLRSALNEVPDLPEADARLARYYRSRLEVFEAARDFEAAAQTEVLLRAHARDGHAAFLRGDALLSLATDPPGASATLMEYLPHQRRLVLGPPRALGRTPLRDLVLPAGSYMLLLEAPGRQEVRYPLSLQRGQRWSGTPSGDPGSHPVWLPPAGLLGEHDLYVPAGPFVCGGDRSATEGFPLSRPWLDAFVIRRFPVTKAEYLEFLNELVREGRGEEAERRAPKEPLGRSRTTMTWLRREDGRFALDPRNGALEAQRSWPVSLVDWHDACAYAAWLAQKTGVAWRLPSELEREKAARGVDGRLLPWGDHFDHTYACVVDSHPGDPGPTSVHDYPLDESPYGVRGLAGNVRDWCIERWERHGPRIDEGVARWTAAEPDDPSFRAVRGGAWTAVAERVRMASRFAAKPTDRFRGQGFRLVRSLPEPNQRA